MTIVPMKEAHVAPIAALEKECFGDPWSEKSIASELNNPLSFWLVAMEEDTLVGYAGSQTCMDETDMMNIAVSPAHRNKGVGKALMEALVEALKKKGSRCLTLEVRASNEGAIALYAKLGFAQIGLRKNYYHNPREDALILRKEWTL
mgnify:FL=1